MEADCAALGEDELWLVFHYLSCVGDVVSCLLVCKRWHNIANINSIWKTLFNNFLSWHFPAPHTIDSNTNWREEFGKCMRRAKALHLEVEGFEDMDAFLDATYSQENPFETTFHLKRVPFFSHLGSMPAPWRFVPFLLPDRRSPPGSTAQKCLLFRFLVSNSSCLLQNLISSNPRHEWILPMQT